MIEAYDFKLNFLKLKSLLPTLVFILLYKAKNQHFQNYIKSLKLGAKSKKPSLQIYGDIFERKIILSRFRKQVT